MNNPTLDTKILGALYLVSANGIFGTNKQEFISLKLENELNLLLKKGYVREIKLHGESICLTSYSLTTNGIKYVEKLLRHT